MSRDDAEACNCFILQLDVATVKPDIALLVERWWKALFRLRPFPADGKRSGQFEKPAAQRGIVDPVIGADQLDRLAPAQRVGIKGFPGRFGKPGGDCRRPHRIHVVEEKRYRDIPDPAQIVQPTGTDAIRATLILLDLLEGQADRLTELLLAQAEHVTPQTDARADMAIDRVRLVALAAAMPPGLSMHFHVRV